MHLSKYKKRKKKRNLNDMFIDGLLCTAIISHNRGKSIILHIKFVIVFMTVVTVHTRTLSEKPRNSMWEEAEWMT